MTTKRKRPERRPRQADEPMLHIRLDRQIADALRERATAEGRYLTPVVTDAILAYLDTEVSR